MTNLQKLLAQPYGDNLVARCDNCGKPVFKCKCDDEDEEDEWECNACGGSESTCICESNREEDTDLMQHDYMREQQAGL